MECRFCQKSFSKGEHLRRHERSHTGVRPFRCKECQRPFARQDSLARHEKLHDRKENNHYPSPPASHASQQSTAALSPLGIPDSMNHQSPQSTSGSTDVFVSEIAQTPSATTNFQMNPTVPSAELDFDLMWPDSEDLFETLLNTDIPSQWQLPLATLPAASNSAKITPQVESPASQTSLRDPGNSTNSVGHTFSSGESHRAVHNVSEMVTTLSSSITAAVAATSLTSVFLDECLHMFFARFIPTFPVLHRATFVFRECTQPLLLNAMAIGSLYLGPKDSIAKGEALWRLAHVAVTTSWEILITHRGPYDACQGVQLVVTALLAQVYGALSKNRVVRTTSQAFHALGFFWARQCALSDSEPFTLTSLPAPDATDTEKKNAWRLWASREIQQRALLGHYLVDGLISRMSGEVPSVRHGANQLGLPSTEVCFEARNADEWLNHMRSQQTNSTHFSFRKILSSLFLPPGQDNLIHYTFSAFSLRVVLEGLQSLLSECDNTDDAVLLGCPTLSSIRHALTQLHTAIAASPNISSAERLELMLRWHTICLDACKDSSLLCRSVCNRYSIAQHVFPARPQHASKPELDLISWAQTEDARRALLHAITIQEIVEQLPRGRAHVIHIPSSLFASAIVYCVFSLAGQTTVNIPAIVDWQAVLSDGLEGIEECETRRYIRGEYLGPRGSEGQVKNLMYELNSMQKLFRCLSSQWGISYDMEPVIDQWIALCH